MTKTPGYSREEVESNGTKVRYVNPPWYAGKIGLLLAVLVGFVAAAYYGQRAGIYDLDNLTFENLKIAHRDLLPTSILSEIENMSSPEASLSDSFSVGLNLRQEGYEVHHPVILVPGVISTGLESWGLEGPEGCSSKSNYRKRMWGSWHMIRTMLTDKECWLKHIKLDPETGLDPPGVRLRAAQGIESADFFMTGYWILNKLIENLSALGYDTNSLSVAGYDWRLGYPDLEKRDLFFSKLKHLIELNRKLSGKKTVLAGHSMGSQVIFYFFKWVEAEGYGNGGPRWVNDNVDSLIDISGSMLGAPKTVAAVLSGEMKDTVQLNSMAMYGLETFFGRAERQDLMMHLPGAASMLPKGGAAVWGDHESAPDDLPEITNSTGSYGKFLRFRETKSDHSAHNLTIMETHKYLLDNVPDWFRNRVESIYSHGLAKTRAEVEKNDKDPGKWINPLEVALPYAPDLKIYCFYGVGKPTERAYTYKDLTDDKSTPLNVAIAYEDENAVLMGEGDGTIPLLTHAMCHRWKDPNSKFNPGNSKITIVEMLHEPGIFDLRGGAKTAEHVDILGRTELNELVLRVVAGRGHEIESRYESDLAEYVKKIDLGED